MEPALKQRLIGATVLVALAVIFLPMLIKGPAPESGASDVPLKLPDAPQGEFETRELPLVTPGQAPQGGAVGMDAGDADRLPTVDTTATAAATATPDAATSSAAGTAGGNYAVSFGSYASSADADRVVKALASAQLPGYQEAAPASGSRTLYRVRIGPYATQAEAEAARLQSARVRSDVGAKVVTLDADAADPAAAAQTAAVAPAPAVSAPVPLADSTPATRPAPLPSEPAKAAVTKAAVTKPPVEAPAKPAAKPAPTTVASAAPVAAPARPAAADTGFAVQLGAFGSAEEAAKLRDRARAAGFSAFVEQVRTDKGVLNRVRVGPVASRADADQLKGQVSAKLGVSGIVRPHP
ncbi:SPOR domain-containing protein [Lysobacter sp. TAF61]|uniref:SPOR domain-containing protein n=1 Tax=Lysobacter sp. TAF61 TaxID=3233072 RepID=UPI003F9C008E